MNVSPAQLWYMTHLRPTLVSEDEAMSAYKMYGSKPLTSFPLEKLEEALIILKQAKDVQESPKELASFLQVLNNSLKDDLNQTIFMQKVTELQNFLKDTCAKSTYLTVATRKEGDKLIHEFVISAKS